MSEKQTKLSESKLAYIQRTRKKVFGLYMTLTSPDEERKLQAIRQLKEKSSLLEQKIKNINEKFLKIEEIENLWKKEKHFVELMEKAFAVQKKNFPLDSSNMELENQLKARKILAETTRMMTDSDRKDLVKLKSEYVQELDLIKKELIKLEEVNKNNFTPEN